MSNFKKQQQFNDQTMKMNQELDYMSSNPNEMIDGSSLRNPQNQQQQFNQSNLSNQKNSQMSMQQLRAGGSPGQNMERHKLSTPERNKQTRPNQQRSPRMGGAMQGNGSHLSDAKNMGQPNMGGNLGGRTPQRNLAMKADQMGGDARLSLKSQTSGGGGGGGSPHRKKGASKEGMAIGNLPTQKLQTAGQQMSSERGPPTYRSMGEDDDLLQNQLGVSMPSMNPGNPKFNPGMPGGMKDPKFQKPGMGLNAPHADQMNMPGQAPNIKGKMNFDKARETSQIFGIKGSGMKKPDMGGLGQMPGQTPGTALLDDDNISLDYPGKPQGIELGRRDLPQNQPQLKSGKKGKMPDLKLGSSIAGSVPDEKQKLIQVDSPKFRGSVLNQDAQGHLGVPGFGTDRGVNFTDGSARGERPPQRSMRPQSAPNADEGGFSYKWGGRGQETIVSSDIRRYTMPTSKAQKDYLPANSTRKLKYETEQPKKTEAVMNPINEALHFTEPRDRASLDSAINEYYARNSFVRYVDGDEDPVTLEQKLRESMRPQEGPNLSEATIKDVRNIHISSDHQRAYVWVITTRKAVGSQVMLDTTRELWLQVYSLSANWSSLSSISSEQNQKLQMLTSLRDEVEGLRRKIETGPKDKAKKEARELRDLLKQRTAVLQQFELEVYKDMELFNPMQNPDVDQESQCFHLVEHYQSVHPPAATEEADRVKASKYFQRAQRSEFSVHLGSFDEPKLDYLSDPIQSFYKQFVSSEEGLYFFKYETNAERMLQDQLNPLAKQTPFGGSQPQHAPHSAISGTSQKTGVDSQSDAFSNQQVAPDKMPVLYKLSPYECKAERVMVNGNMIRLPFDAYSNQFAIVRALDPQLSRELSTIDNLMFAILKEVHVKQDEFSDDGTASQINRRMSKNKRNQLQQRIIESRIEIYKANQADTTFGCNVDLKEVPARLDPKNLSVAHRQEQDDDESYKPVKKDFNFCCWYLIDQSNLSLNVAILLNEQMINMRTPFEYDSERVSIEEFNKRLVVAKNQRLKIDDIDEVPFLEDYKISQNMPIYAIDLKEPTNFAKLPCFLKAANDAKLVWNRELLQSESDPSKRFPPEKMMSPLQPQHQLQNLLEFQEQVFLNFDVPLERIYVILRQRPNDIDFEVLFPIVPDYLWASEDGLRIREEIDQIILHTYKKYLPEEPTQKSYKIEGVNKMLYSEQYNQAFQNKGDHEKVKQYSRESTSLQQVMRPGVAARRRWTKDAVRQCVSFHHIFLKQINDAHEGKERNTSLQQMSPNIFAEETLHQYGLAHFQCTWEAMKGIVNQKSLKLAKTAQYSVLVDEHAEGESTSAGRGRVRSNKKMRKANSTQQQIEELAQEIKSPRSSKSDALQSPRALSKPRTILVAGGLKEPKDHEGLKVKFQFEKMCVCEGLRNFIHIIKYKKKHMVKRNNLGEVIKILYKNNYYAFEEDFEFFDYEIVIGQLDVSLRQHCLNVNEERDPLKRTQQILAQYEHYDGIFTPLQNPHTPYQQLVMSYDIDGLKEEERLMCPPSARPQKEPLKIMQVCQKQTTCLVADPDHEELCQMKNLPAEFSFQEFLHNGEFRKEYFEAQLLQVSNIRQVEWIREQPDAFPLQDYVPEQAMAKVWVPAQSSAYNQLFDIKTVDVMDLISRQKEGSAKYLPKANVILDSRLEASPQNYALLRSLLLDDMTLTTVKQMKSNPRNIVLALRQKREMSMAQEVNQNGTATDKTMAVHMVGQLDEHYANLKYLFVIRQQSNQRQAQAEYSRREKPLQQSTNVLEIYSFSGFAVEFADANSKMSCLNPAYGRTFDQSYKNCRMMAFDQNFGDSIDPDVEVFAVRTWKPLNAVKIFTFNFEACQLQEIYEIPVSGDLLEQLQNIQLVRVSDVKQAYALMLDWCSVKEIFLIEFTSRPAKAKQGQLRQNLYKGSLIGKYDFICPNMAEAQYFSGGERIFVPNLQVKMVPLYKQFDPKDDNVDFVGESRALTRDGFSLIYDQGRVDFDYLYFSNLVGHSQIELHLQNAANVFEYEYRITEKMKRNLNKECEVDFKFFQALIIKVRFRKEILQSELYTENEKLKMLTYFSKTIQGHRSLDYSLINEKIARIGIRVDIFRNQDYNYFLHPRSELYGANLLTFLDDDVELVERVLQRRLEAVRASKQKLIDLYSRTLVMPFLPNISGNKFPWQKHQYGFVSTKPRFCELDMNLMSPIGWALYHKCHNTVKQYVDHFRNLSKISSKEEIGDHSVIFYSCIKQLLQLGTLELAEFLDPDGVGEDVGCELFQQTLKLGFLPQFESSAANFTNEYKRSIHTLERNMQQALMIDEIQSAKKAFKDDEQAFDSAPTYEVQYGLIDLAWVNALNVFDQEPIHRCSKRQRATAKRSKKGATQEFDWAAEIKRHKQKAMPLIGYINSEKNLDTYKYQSIKLLVDHYWTHQSYDFFKTQFFIFLIFFVFPFGVDLYYLMTVTMPHGDVTAAQVLFGFLALACQGVFFLSELLQLASEGKSLRTYFGDFWNFNDFFCLPVYLATLITTWSWAGSEDATAGQAAAIKVLYMLVICQTFVKLLFLMRIFEPMAFFLLLLPKIVWDLGPFVMFALMANVLFSALYMVLEVELSNEYTLLFPPLKWLIFTLRNALHDFYVDETDGFLQHFSNRADSAALSDGKGVILYLSWIVWIANTLLVTVILFSLVISIIGQSYEQVLGDAEARLYRQKAELIVECQQVLLKLGYIKAADLQSTLLIRKKKFADDVSERLNMENWSGLTQSLKMYMQFNVIAQLEAQSELASARSHQVNAALSHVLKSLNDVQRRQRASSGYSRPVDPDPFEGGEHGNNMDVDKSKITYDPSLNNISH